MNLLLLKPSQFINEHTALIDGRAFDHAQTILKVAVGDQLTVGLVNGYTGRATVQTLTSHTMTLQVPALSTPPPPVLPVKLLLGLPRPRMLHRLLQTVATMGVMELHLLQTSRVEKSFWQTPLLEEKSIEEQLTLGLEQGKATQMPKVFFHKRFIPFMEDTLPSLLPNTQGFIAHPCHEGVKKDPNQGMTLLAIGPEGGFIEQEVQQFVAHGFAPISLGPRILKVETAVPVALSKLF